MKKISTTTLSLCTTNTITVYKNKIKCVTNLFIKRKLKLYFLCSHLNNTIHFNFLFFFANKSHSEAEYSSKNCGNRSQCIVK